MRRFQPDASRRPYRLWRDRGAATVFDSLTARRRAISPSLVARLGKGVADPGPQQHSPRPSGGQPEVRTLDLTTDRPVSKKSLAPFTGVGMLLGPRLSPRSRREARHQIGGAVEAFRGEGKSRAGAFSSRQCRSHGTSNSLENEDAMKRKIQVQPLQLSRETIRQLDSDKLAAINGGFTETITTIFSVVVSCAATR